MSSFVMLYMHYPHESRADEQWTKGNAELGAVGESRRITPDPFYAVRMQYLGNTHAMRAVPG